MNRPVPFLFCLFCIFASIGTPSTSAWGQSPEWAQVMATHEALRSAQTQSDRLALHDQLQSMWPEALAAGHAFSVDWGLWNHAVVDLGEGDERMVVFTWNVELDNRTQRYGGWVAHAAPDTELGYVFTSLTHDPEVKDTDVTRLWRHDQWAGGLYYDGMLTYDKGSPVYTLVAWDGADALTNRKKIETLEPRNGRVRFGAPRFDMPTGLQKRVVLTYGDAVQATLRVEPSLGRIVFDHLAPEDPSLRGQYAFYGPTLSYDGLEWRKGRCQFVSDVPVRNAKDGTNREYRDPRGRRRGN